MSDKDEIECSRQIRTNCKSKLTKFGTFLEKCQIEEQNISVEEIQIRVNKIEETWTEYNKAQLVLEIKAPTVTREAERAEFENVYFSSMALAIKLIKERSVPLPLNRDSSLEKDQLLQQRVMIARLEAELRAQREAEIENLRQISVSRNSNADSESSTVRSHFLLPKLDLPTFSGKYEKWLGFKDTFMAIIHRDTTIPKVQKLRYLKSYVKGNAAQVIENIEISEASYDEVWKLLEDRYDNKRIIIQNHMMTLFELKTPGKESASCLRNFVDSISRHIRALKVLNEPIENWDTPLICLVASKLDRDSRREWEKSLKGSEMPTFDLLIEFLRERCQLLEALNPVMSDQSKQNSKPFNKELDPHDRFQMIKGKGLCFNCLKGGHLIGDCKSRNCNVCNKRHHTLLHRETQSNDNEKKESEIKESNAGISGHVNNSSTVILSTAIINVIDNQGNKHNCRVILDSGSQPNLMTRQFADKLKLSRKRINSAIETINGTGISSCEWLNAKLESRHSDYNAELSFLIFPKITSDIPFVPIDKIKLNLPPNIKLADPHFDRPASVDALLGAELFYELLGGNKIPLSIPHTSLQSTRLGWIVTGNMNQGQPPLKLSCNLTKDATSQQLEKFWTLEEYKDVKHMSKEDALCEKHFVDTTQRDSSGKFIVRLPFNEKKEELGYSYGLAKTRFHMLERKLSKDEELRKKYNGFMQQYVDTGHMELSRGKKEEGLYIPHHCIFKESSTTTKLRVVFDGSAKTSTGVSLNEALMVGPTIQDTIFTLMMRFRSHPIALTADVEKMYRQFWVHHDDQKFQKILWRFNEKEPIKIYQLKTVTYTSAAPFLAVRCLKQLAKEEESQFPVAARVLSEDFFVDDALTGAESPEEAQDLQQDLISLTAKAGLPLCKWRSNCQQIMQDDYKDAGALRLDMDHASKTLGVMWDSHEDHLFFQVDSCLQEKVTTKRSMLSQIAKLYDPLGIIGPVIIYAKIKMQDLWKSKTSWDDPVPPKILSEYEQYQGQIHLLKDWRLDRTVRHQGVEETQIHGFADASEKAYGAGIYIRTRINGSYRCILLCAKSRVAPMKVITLPRLELCAAVLLARLLKTVRESIKKEVTQVRLWSDSTIVLN